MASKLKPKVGRDAATLSFSIEKHGYGAVLAVETGKPPEALARCCRADAAERAKIRWRGLSAQWKLLAAEDR